MESDGTAVVPDAEPTWTWADPNMSSWGFGCCIAPEPTTPATPATPGFRFVGKKPRGGKRPRHDDQAGA